MEHHERIERLVAEMTLPEKVGQMTQADKGSITPAEVADLGIGSVLSGGGGNPEPNDPWTWASMVGEVSEAAAGSRLGVPLLYGVDAVHGHANVRGATVFPHQISLGAAGDADLARRVARATAVETAATGVHWNYAPCVAVPQELRWGRTYEGYGADPDLVSRLSAAQVEGLQGGPAGPNPDDPTAVLACAKHYVGDGAAMIGTSPRIPWNSWWDAWNDARIDHGDTDIDEAELRRLHLAPYRAAVDAGVATVMASYSSWQGRKMHGHRYLLDDVLRGELGFAGPVVSDWMGIDQLDPDYRTCVVRAISAGVDVVMVPIDYERFRAEVLGAIAAGDLAEERIDEAVRRILGSKAALGLLDGRRPAPPSPDVLGDAAHRDLAREAARRSLVLLRGEGSATIPAGASVMVDGEGADDVGLQCGGWTVEWQGARGDVTDGTTILEALRTGHDGRVDAGDPGSGRFDVGVFVAVEEPYAEGVGDRPHLDLEMDLAAFTAMRAACDRVVLVLLSGRPVVLPPETETADAVVAAWLPGSEGDGVADVLLGRHPFTGRLPQPWPASSADLDDPAALPRYPVGHG